MSVKRLGRRAVALAACLLLGSPSVATSLLSAPALAATQVQGAQIAASPVTAGDLSATYTASLTTDAPVGGSQPAIYLDLPAGTVLPSTTSGDYAVSANGSAVAVTSVSTSDNLVALDLGTTIGAGASVVVTLVDVANPPVAGPYQAAVWTSGDGSQVDVPYTIAPAALPSSLAGSTVVPSPQSVNASVPAQPPSITVAVTLADGQGQQVAGKTVALDAFFGGAYGWSVSPASAVTDGSGIASFTVGAQGGYASVGPPLLLGAYDTTDGQFVGGAAVYFYQLTFSGGAYVGAVESVGGSGLPPDAQVTAATFGESIALTLSGPCQTDAGGNLGSCSFVVPVARAGVGYPITLTLDGVQFSQNLTVVAASSGSAQAASLQVSGGNGQSAEVGRAFVAPLSVLVEDGQGNPFADATVHFAVVPGQGGAGASFAGGVATATAQSQANGIATAPALTANLAAGSYTVQASVQGVGSVSFTLTNTSAPRPPPPPPASIQATGGGGQAAVLGTAFAQALGVRVLDAAGQPVSGAAVTFSAPAAGASAVFPNGRAAMTVPTDAAGLASLAAVASGGTGPFQVTASVPGMVAVATFVLKDANAIVQTCDDASVQAAFVAGGYVAFSCSGTITLSRTLTLISGEVTLDATGDQVTLEAPGALPQCFAFEPTGTGAVSDRAFDVEGGQLTLLDLTVACGDVAGAAGGNGAKGLSSGRHATAGGAGAAGTAAEGGAMYIADGARVTVVDSTFSDNVAYGGAGGWGGSGGTGLFASNRAGANGAAGGNGGAGGAAAGGAIYNLGALTLDDVQFVDNAAFGGPGGRGGNGGAGAGGAPGTPGSNGSAGSISANCGPPGPGQAGGVGGDGRPGGAGGAGGAGGQGGTAQGGAVYSLGSVDIAGATFVGNLAGGGSGGAGLGGGNGGLGGVGGTGGKGGTGGNFIDGTCKKYLAPGAGGAGGTGGASGNSASGGLGGAGGGGGSAHGAALWAGGSLTASSVAYIRNTAMGGLGGGGGGGGGAPGGSHSSGGPGGGGGVQCASAKGCHVLLGSTEGAPGKGGSAGPKALGGTGGLGGDGGGGGDAQGGTDYLKAGTAQVSLAAASDSANQVVAGAGGFGGPGGCTAGPVFVQGGKPTWGCAVTTGAVTTRAKSAAAGTAGPSGGATGADGYVQPVAAASARHARHRMADAETALGWRCEPAHPHERAPAATNRPPPCT